MLMLLFAYEVTAKPFTGTFVADGRPRWMEFLSLTQTELGVRGFLLVVEPDGRGGTKSETATVEGAADGNELTLRTETFLNLGSTTIGGRVAGAVLTLSFPSSSGQVTSTRFKRGGQEAFNAALTIWQTQLKAAFIKQRKIEEILEARAAKARAAIEAASALREAALALVDAGKDLERFAVFKQQLSGCQVALKAMTDFADRLDHDAQSDRCLWLRSQVDYLSSQLEYLRGARAYLEEHAVTIDERTRDFQQQRGRFEQQLRAFDRATADDPTGSVSAVDARNLDDASRKLLGAAIEEVEHTQSVLRDGRSNADVIVNNGAELYKEVSRRVSAPCRHE
ncbi:MAG TPA: hypothetical protein VHX14_01800 [Thermoanaerobaculia bacterium]|nr:hypothetical protein [Thermoanaerobaculia bacterium]